MLFAESENHRVRAILTLLLNGVLALALAFVLVSVSSSAAAQDSNRGGGIRQKTALKRSMQKLRDEAAQREVVSLNEASLQQASHDGAPNDQQALQAEGQGDVDLLNDIVRQAAESEDTPEQAATAPVGESEIHHPVESLRWSSLLPPQYRRQLHQRLARGLEKLAIHELTVRAHAQWVALEPERIAAWHGLARARVRAGKLNAAETALRGALQQTRATLESPFEQDPRSENAPDKWNWQLHRDLGELYLLQGRLGDAVAALAIAAEMQPDNERIAGLLAQARHHLDPAMHAKPDAEYVPWPAPDSAMRARAIFLGSILGFLILSSMLIRALRGKGDLVVALAYPAELKGDFRVRLSRQRGQRKRRPTSDTSGKRASSRMEHYSVSRETHFRRVRTGSYYVSVEGVLRDPETNAPLTNPFEERNVLIFRGGTARLELDLSPNECPVDVRVLWDKRPVKDASVASRGLPQSLRYTRDGDVRLRLPKGTHTIAVGSGDRVAERAVVVQSFQPIQLTIDLAGSEDVIFKGCPPAVTPYLHGDLSAAARALELDGHTQISHLLRARLHHERGQTEQAAKHFALAGRLIEAAELQMRIKKFAAAAELFERADEPFRAAEMHRAADDLLAAGAAYERAEEFDRAAECFAEAGETARQVTALEKAGRPYEAADLALSNHDRARAIKLLQLVGPEDSNFANACRRLTEAFEHEGHLDLAAERLERLIDEGIQDDLPELHWKLADLFEGCDQVEKALSTLTSLRELAPTFPNVAGRIETLRKQLSDGLVRQQAGGAGAQPNAFPQEERYELLEEIGRGGMGVVFRARDTRLKRIVALKRLPENLKDHPKAIALFMREAQSAARLNHVNIVTVYDTDQTSDGTFFITMELLAGLPLNVILLKRGKLRPKDAVQVCMQVAIGLQYAHDQGIIHRDIKTANLFFTSDKVVKIMDFGLAKMVEEVRRGTTIMGGTPFYMAPEQGVGGAVDHRADIYAFGVTMYELLTGSVPFPDGDVTFHHRHTPPPDPRTKVPDLPEALVELVASMMEKKPEPRCGSANEVLERLKRIF